MKMFHWYWITLYNWTVKRIVNPVLWQYTKLRIPWVLACFNSAWVEYQQGPVYRERLVNFGLGQAIYGFFNSRWERQYCLKLRCQRESWLRWKIFFTPFSIPVPEELMAASRDGYFDPDVKKKLNII